jgi:hypothetical protein
MQSGHPFPMFFLTTFKSCKLIMTHSQLIKGPKCGSKWNTSEEGGVGAHSLVHNTLKGRGACWSSGMGLGRVDKLHSLTHTGLHTTHTKWLVHSWNTLGARMSHGLTRTHKTHHGPDLGEATTFPIIVYSVAGHGAYIQMAFLSRDSRVGVPKSRQLGLLQLWSPITLRADLRLRCGLKKSCSSCQELSNDMWHAPCS